MGRVWRAADEILDRQVAVKEMRIDGLDAEDARTRRERTLREARATARIDHPNVVRVYDVVDEGERLWIVMELVTGRSLERIMAEDGPLGPRETALLGLGLVEALRQVHERGVLHRDIKPGNVLVEARAGRIVLTDFGIAAIQDAKALTMVGMLVGSPDYMAPERVSGRPQGPPSDVWSLGATLCAAMGGRSPFSRDTTLATLHAVLYEEPELPALQGPLRDILAALLEKDPTVRPNLEELEASLRLLAHPPPTPTVRVLGGDTGGVPPWGRDEPTGGRQQGAPRELTPRLPVESDASAGPETPVTSPPAEHEPFAHRRSPTRRDPVPEREPGEPTGERGQPDPTVAGAPFTGPERLPDRAAFAAPGPGVDSGRVAPAGVSADEAGTGRETTSADERVADGEAVAPPELGVEGERASDGEVPTGRAPDVRRDAVPADGPRADGGRGLDHEPGTDRVAPPAPGPGVGGGRVADREAVTDREPGTGREPTTDRERLAGPGPTAAPDPDPADVQDASPSHPSPQHDQPTRPYGRTRYLRTVRDPRTTAPPPEPGHRPRPDPEAAPSPEHTPAPGPDPDLAPAPALGPGHAPAPVPGPHHAPAPGPDHA
ncbi:serine/threonine-protein kinase, partial [Streptomyces resistomycificus]|uniref:serine/threonine-protein kinase n=1 Tax=Streptomyces resistomycificus TaxID=67356 RepID=UPI0035BC661D